VILREPNLLVISSEINATLYWDNSVFPDWSRLSTLCYFPRQARGSGTEPHYHDGDEMWLFPSGRGEGWHGDRSFDIEPGTLVYHPKGVVHRFQMFSTYGIIAICAWLEDARRREHLKEHLDGPPTAAGSGGVIAGRDNGGQLEGLDTRCPLIEARIVTLAPEVEHASPSDGRVHWLAVQGLLSVALDGRQLDLAPGDLAMSRDGAIRSVRSMSGGLAALVRERPSASSR
jgi:mannose-6-phosphate isomerase-like protein (cupin superfamily)